MSAVARRPKPTRILIVDDDRSLANSLRAFLAEKGFEAATAYSGVEGLAWAAVHKPDCVICDVLMPDIPGTAVAIELRHSLPACRIALMTEFPSFADLRTAPWRDIHRFEIVFKPIDYGLILDWLSVDST
jgi:two-component system, OmpR family, response regulator